MNYKYLTILFLTISFSLLPGCTQVENRKQVSIITQYGSITLDLYNETPKHRDNFIKLINDSFYKDLLFHRVIKNFVIQGGDPDSKNATPGQLLGEGDLEYKIPAEFHKKLFHKKGVLAAARESDAENPMKESSAAQFYIVQGKIFTPEELDLIESKKNNSLYAKKVQELKSQGVYDTVAVRNYVTTNKFSFPESHRKIYTTLGGTPNLDQNYTVFGEVSEGMEVVEKIANLQTDTNDRPLEDIRFTIIMKK
jgi:cyclophilin family peptidyl-prolyl cis-trans isomerase